MQTKNWEICKIKIVSKKTYTFLLILDSERSNEYIILQLSAFYICVCVHTSSKKYFNLQL